MGSRMSKVTGGRLGIRFATCALTIVIPLAVLTTSTGCIQQMAQLLYVIKGHKIPPKFAGLEGKRVAVLCLTDASAYGPDTLTYSVGKHVSGKIASGVKDVQVVSPGKVEAWIDENGWEESSVVAIGEEVKAEMFIVLEMGSYSIHDGATLYKGKADLTVTVYDIEKGGQVAFSDGPELFAFPENGRPVMQTNKRKFEAFYLSRLTDHISRLFVAYDKMDSFAEDAMMN